MNENEPFGRRAGDDPFSEFFRAWMSLWAFPPRGQDRRAGAPLEGLNEFFWPWVAMFAPWVAQEGFKKPPTEPPRGGEKVMTLLAQGYAIALTSHFRYLALFADSSGRYYRTVARRVEGMTGDAAEQPDAMRFLLDESAAELRELGDLWVQEARTLQTKLLQLANEMRQQSDEKRDKPHRNAKAKA